MDICPSSHTGPDDILEHNAKPTLDLVWQIIVAYQLGEGGRKQQLMAKRSTRDQLLAWVNAALPKKGITNFTTDWRDGSNLLGLVKYCKPGLVPNDSLTPRKGLHNVKQALRLAEEHFGIPQLLDPEDLVDRPEECSVMTYISYFCCVGSPGATVLLEWIQRKIPNMKVTNLSTDWVSGLALGALANAVSRGAFPAYEDMASSKAVENCKTTMEFAKDQLDIDPNVRPEDFTNRKLGHLQRIAYLAQYASVRLPPKVIEVQVPVRPGTDEKVELHLECPEGTDESSQITATAKGEATGTVPVEIEELSDTHFRIGFVPDEEDVYTLSVDYGEDSIKGSPFVFNLGPPDASRVCHKGNTLPKKVGDVVVLAFDTSEAGSGQLTAKTRGEKSRVVATDLEVVPIGDYKATFTAHLADVYSVEVKLEDKEVRGSPFILDLSDIADPSKVECGEASYEKVGEPIHLPVDVSKAGKGKLRVECKGSNEEEVEVEIKPSEDSPKEIVFVPLARDQYTIHVFYEDVEIDASPLEVDLRPIAPNAGEISRDKPTADSMRVGEEIRITFNTANAGNGKMNAICRGESVGNVPISVVKLSRGKHGVKFIPPEEDIYMIDVLWTRTPVPGSPFTINLIPEGRPDASKCQIVDLQAIPRIVAVGDAFTLDVLSAGAGNGNLVVEAEGPMNLQSSPNHNHKEACDTDSDSNSIGDGESSPVVRLVSRDPPQHSVSYTPMMIGVHKLQLLWSGKEIPGSPFRVEAIVATTCAYGGPAILDLRTVHKRKNMKAHAVRVGVGDSAKKKAQLKVRIDKVMTGHFKLVCDLKQLGIHYVHVYAKGKEIVGSPFIVNYTKAASPELCTVHGLLKIGWVGVPFHFTVDTTQAGDGELLVYRRVLAMGMSRMSSRLSLRQSVSKQSVYSTIEDLDPDFIVTDNRDGTKGVIYTPSSSGDVDVEVTFAGTPIPGSPFHLLIRNKSETDGSDVISIDIPKKLSTTKRISSQQLPGPAEMAGLTFENTKLRVGIPHQFKLHCEDFGDHPPDITCKPQDAASIAVTLAPGKNSYWCEITPQKSGKHTIAVKYDGSHIFGSPFHVKFKAAANAQKCRMVETTPECQTAAGNNVVCCVSTDGAGKGKLTAAVQSCMSKRYLSATVALVHKHHYNIEFNPTEGSRYTLTIKYDDTHIQGSPFDLALGDPSKCRVEGDGLTYAQVGKELRFVVYTEAAGPGFLEVEIHRGEDLVLSPSIAEIADHEYEISYIPQAGGIHAIYVLWGEVEIPGCPFSITCVDPLQFTVAPPPPELCLGMETKLMVTTEAYTAEEKLTFTLVGLDDSVTEGTVHKIEDLTYNCSVVPPGIGKYRGHVKWGGIDVSGSPFELEVELSPQPEEFTIEAFELEVTALGVRVLGPKRCLRYGKVTSTVINSSTKEELPVTVSQSTEDWCDVHFHPEPGHSMEYLLTIEYDGQDIRGSPFTLIATDASQCYSGGKGLKKARTTDWNEFRVYTENAGRGELSVFILREVDHSPVEPDIDQRKETEYLVKYLPSEHGFHSISIKWGNQHIPGSPFRVYCSDPAKFHVQKVPREICLGEPVEVSVLADDNAEDSKYLRILARSKNKEDAYGKVYKVDEQDYTCSIKPSALGKLMVHVRCGGYEIDGSPFKIRVMPPPVPENVRVFGQGIQDGYVGQEGQFTIDVSDAGYGYVSFKVHGPKRAFKIHMSHHPNVDDAILAQYYPGIAGTYTISVLWSNVHVPGSPFAVTVHECLPGMNEANHRLSITKPPLAKKCIVSGPDIPLEDRDPVELIVDTSNAGPGCLLSKLVSESSPNVLVDIKQVEPKIYRLAFTPSIPELYTLTVTWGGEDVPGSPFELDLSPPKPNAVVVKEAPSATVQAGEAIKVCFGTKMAGRGQLTATCTGRECGEIPVMISQSRNPTLKYDVELTPFDKDVYSLNVLWAGEHVKGSPFRINLTGQDE